MWLTRVPSGALGALRNSQVKPARSHLRESAAEAAERGLLKRAGLDCWELPSVWDCSHSCGLAGLCLSQQSRAHSSHKYALWRSWGPPNLAGENGAVSPARIGAKVCQLALISKPFDAARRRFEASTNKTSAERGSSGSVALKGMPPLWGWSLPAGQDPHFDAKATFKFARTSGSARSRTSRRSST